MLLNIENLIFLVDCFFFFLIFVSFIYLIDFFFKLFKVVKSNNLIIGIFLLF